MNSSIFSLFIFMFSFKDYQNYFCYKGQKNCGQRSTGRKNAGSNHPLPCTHARTVHKGGKYGTLLTYRNSQFSVREDFPANWPNLTKETVHTLSTRNYFQINRILHTAHLIFECYCCGRSNKKTQDNNEFGFHGGELPPPYLVLVRSRMSLPLSTRLEKSEGSGKWR